MPAAYLKGESKVVERYIGHPTQLYGVEEHRLVGGKGDGMRLLEVKNGRGIAFTIASDRCADISRLSLDGVNYGFFAANGYVAPTYYDDKGTGWLKGFTAGFLTTCGLLAVGSPTVDEGEELPLHGAIGNIPAENIYWDMDDEKIWVKATIRHAGIFAQKLILTRTISCSLHSNEITIEDSIKNVGDTQSPLMILYHMNMGYPLLSEDAELYIPSQSVVPRNERAAEDLDTWNKVIAPQDKFEEQCYYHQFAGKTQAGIYNHKVQKGLLIGYDADALDCFTEWKMMGVKDYVMGLEPGNCYPDGRDVMRQQGKLKFINPGQEVKYAIHLSLYNSEQDWKNGQNK